MRNPDEQGVSATEWIREGRILMALYAVFYGTSGLAGSYFPYYFDDRGLSAAAIGAVFGVRTVFAIVGQPPLSALADRLGRPRRLLSLAFGVGAVAGGLLLYADGFWTIAACVWLSAPIVAAVVPLLDAVIVRRAGVARYGRYRLWGSIGFGVVVAGYGLAVRSMSHAQAGGLALFVFVVLSALGAMTALTLRPVPGRAKEARRIAPFAPGAAFVVFVGAHALHWSASAVFNIYLSLHVRDAGMAVWVPGVAFGTAIVGEVVAFALAGRFLRDENALRWLVAICLTGVLRWLVTAWAPSVEAVVLVQLQHFLAFGVWYSLAIRQLGRFAPADRRTTVQGVFTAGCFGVGTLVGSLAGGTLMDAWGGGATFAFAAAAEVAALIGFVVSQRTLPPADASASTS